MNNLFEAFGEEMVGAPASLNFAKRDKLSPLFKWTGGKRREIKFFEDMFPHYVLNNDEYRYVEPFMGGGAVYWYLNNYDGTNVINDYDYDLVNFYRQVQAQSPRFLDNVADASKLYEKNEALADSEAHDVQEANYYKWRNMDKNNGLEKLSGEERAARFWIVNQLAFSGMRRFNGKGEFNVPYGHYKNLNSSALNSQKHVELLSKTEIKNGDYKQVILDNDKENTFIFLDPPYTRVMNTYSADNEFGLDKQEELADTLKNLKNAHFMVVINKDEITSELYKDHIQRTYDLKYGVNIKNRFDQSVQHIVAINY